ncbi:hypothetical protein CH296_27080 [Rhodococcus sp. 14-2496-1d]|nr:hypothetical protein CH296_27080 [Rhodococcus sp. 14-2496-1d]
MEKVASTSVELERADAGLRPPRWAPDSPVRQFSLAAVARTALVEYGRRAKATPDRPVTDRELHDLCGMSIDTDHPDVPEVGVLGTPEMTRMIARLMYQQGVFGYSAFENISRSIGLLVEHDAGACDLPSPAEWKDVLGVTLTDYMTIVFQLGSLATTYGGRLTLDTIRECRKLGFFAGADPETVLGVIRNHLAAPLRTLAVDGRRDELAEAKMWSYNPLMGHPLIDDGRNGYLLPIHRYLIEKITPLGLFFTGLTAFGDTFPVELGKSFELYIGQQLALLERVGAVIHPEIVYGRHGGMKTVDYFVVLDEVVVLVEVKLFKATAPARAGVTAGLEALVHKVQRARRQIDKTAALLRAGTPELADIPTDRPLRGLVVTSEPLHSIDTFLYEDMFEPNEIESSTASAHDIERIFPILAEQADAGDRLFAALTSNAPTPPSLNRAVTGLPAVKNPISDALWRRWETQLVPPGSIR